MSKRLPVKNRLLLLTKKVGNSIFGFIKIRRYKSHVSVTLKLQLPRLTKNRRRMTNKGQAKKAVKRKRAISKAFTFSLLFISISGIIFSAALYAAPQLQSSSDQQQIIPPDIKLPGLPFTQTPAGLFRSAPMQISIPAINVASGFVGLRQNPDGSLAVPKRYDIAGWYEFGPAPGEIGPAIIVGHVDSWRGPAIFYRLSELRPGQLIIINRADGQRITFKVDKVAEFDQQNFPTSEVYGNIDHAGLRLITCSGNYSVLSGRYSNNTVVFASQVRAGI